MPLTKPRAYQIYDIDYKQSVRVVSISNVTLSGGTPNSVDGVNLSLNDRVLVVGQTSGVQNGIYYVTTLGSGSNGTWTRSIDTDTTGELDSGTIVMVTEGAIYSDTQWKLITNDPITIGSTALTFVQNYLANSISNGNTSFAIGSSNANATISVAGTSNVAVFSTTGEFVTGVVSATGNVTGGNILTAGIASVTGTITTAAGTNSTGFAVGNGAVSNVGLGFFPTAGTRGDYAIRDYSTVASTMYFDVGMGGTGSGEFQFRTTNAFTRLMTANSAGITTPGRVFGLELNSTQSSGDEGGQINLALAATNTTLSTSVIIDIFQNRLRFFEGGGTARGAYIDLTSCTAGAGTNLLAGGGGGGTPGGSNTNVQFNDGGAFGGNGQFTYNKVTNVLTAGIISANNNGAGTNFQVGDDAWIGDINLADTMSVRGQQNAANGYIVFGNANGAQLGRAGTGPLTYSGAFSASGNVTGGNILTGGIISATGNVSGGNVAAATTIFSLGTIGASGNISGGNLISSGTITAAGNIATSGANGVANIGSVGAFFNTVHARATSAQYADVAEIYVADAAYNPGTVLEFGGNNEVTITTTEYSAKIAGVVSTAPAYLMNSAQLGEYTVQLALLGRVPCKVKGKINKGDRVVSSDVPGVAQAYDSSKYEPGSIIGKALQSWDSNAEGVIEVVVGKI